MQCADLGFLGGEAVALEDRHEIIRASYNRGGSEQQGEDRRVVGENGEDGGAKGNVEGFDCVLEGQREFRVGLRVLYMLRL